MFLSRLEEGKLNTNTTTQKLVINKGGTQAAAGVSSSSRNPFPPLPTHKRGKLLAEDVMLTSGVIKNSEDSDEDVFTVPDMEAAPSVDSALSNPNSNIVKQSKITDPQLQCGKRPLGRNSLDKEYRRLKRLLRNRVSAQQARERKKVYVNDLESRDKELEEENTKLEERISTLINENTMLRKVLMNTRPKVDESNEA